MCLKCRWGGQRVVGEGVFAHHAYFLAGLQDLCELKGPRAATDARAASLGQQHRDCLCFRTICPNSFQWPHWDPKVLPSKTPSGSHCTFITTFNCLANMKSKISKYCCAEGYGMDMPEGSRVSPPSWKAHNTRVPGSRDHHNSGF